MAATADPQSQPNFPIWIRDGKLSKSATARSKDLKAVSRAFGVKTVLTDNVVAATAYREVSKNGDQVPFDENEGQFGVPVFDEKGQQVMEQVDGKLQPKMRNMTQEEIDDEETDFARCEHCKNYSLPCDADDTCGPCEDIDIECQRKDKDDDDVEAVKKRNEMLATGAEGASSILATEERLPMDIEHLVQSVSGVFRRAWKEGCTQELKDEVRDTNQKISSVMMEQDLRPSPGQQFLIPSKLIFERISSMRDSVMLWCADTATSESKVVFAKEFTLYSLGLVTVLDRCGLSWKWIVDPELVQAFRIMWLQAMPHLSDEVQAIIKTFQSRDEKAAGYQREIAQKAELGLTEFFRAVDDTQWKQATTAITQIQDVNNQLVAANERVVGLNKNDHQLPVEVLQTCCSSELQKQDQGLQSQQINQVKNFIIAFLMNGGYDFQTLPEILKIRQPTLTNDFQTRLEQQKLEWRNCIDESLFIPDERDAEKAKPGTTMEAGPETINSTTTASLDNGGSAIKDDQKAHAAPLRPQTKQAEPQAAVQSGLRKSKVTGPVYEDGITSLGQIISVQTVGDRGYRAIVNIGTFNFPVYTMRPGSDFGRGVAAELLGQQYGGKFKPTSLSPEDLKSRKATWIKELRGIAESPPVTLHSTREPITKFLVAWDEAKLAKDAPAESWVTRSELIRIAGKRWTDSQRSVLLADMRHNMESLSRSKAQGLHPETGKKLNEADRRQMPWLFPGESDDPGPSRGKKADKNEDKTDHIRIASKRFPNPDGV